MRSKVSYMPKMLSSFWQHCISTHLPQLSSNTSHHFSLLTLSLDSHKLTLSWLCTLPTSLPSLISTLWHVAYANINYINFKNCSHPQTIKANQGAAADWGMATIFSPAGGLKHSNANTLAIIGCRSSMCVCKRSGQSVERLTNACGGQSAGREKVFHV